MIVRRSGIAAAWLLVLVFAGCASAHRSGDAAGEAPHGPVILLADAEPRVIELNRDFQPLRTAWIIAEVNDFHSQVTRVALHFTSLPLEIPLKKVGETTWRSEIPARQLELLAVTGSIARYEARIFAVNAEGESRTDDRSVQIAIRAPGPGQAFDSRL